MSPKAETALYQLKSVFWDGRREHAPGSQLRFPVGKQPRTAVLVQEPELGPEPAPATVVPVKK
jgi:hypothetical protein